MRRVRIAQIGIGHDHAEYIFKSILKQKDIFDFVGYYVSDDEEIKFKDRLQQPWFLNVPRISLEKILNDPSVEAVAVESEEKNLCNYAYRAALSGKHIHMDKPGGLVLSEFEHLAEFTKKKALTFHLGYMYRYNPEIIKAIKKVRNGELGQIFSVEAQMNCLHTPEKRDWLKSFPGGMMFFLGCHLIDLILTIMGDPNEIIPLNISTGSDGVFSSDFGMVIFKYKNGIAFAKTCSAEYGGFCRRELLISGSKGTIDLRPLEMHTVYPTTYTGVREILKDHSVADESLFKKSDLFDRYDGMMKDFAEIVLGNKENDWSYDYELKLFKTLLKCCSV